MTASGSEGNAGIGTENALDTGSGAAPTAGSPVADHRQHLRANVRSLTA